MAAATTARSTIVATITTRCPPRTRSIAGPISGPTSANGAMVSARPSRTFSRPWAGSTLKNSDPASEMARRASPQTDAVCAIASREKGELQSVLPAARRVRDGGVTGAFTVRS